MKVWRAARILVLLAWLVAATLTWWTTPRAATYEQATAALNGSEAVAYEWGEYWKNNADRWFQPATLSSSGTPGPLFAWRTSDHRVFWTDIQQADETIAPQTGGVDATATTVGGVDYAGVPAAALARQLDQQPTGELIPWGSAIQLISWVLGITFLAVLITGPAPVLGTRWYWFWVVVLVPYALGVVLWALREHPWAPAERPVAHGRDQGWFGFVTGILATFVIAVLLLGLNWLLGDRWVPQSL